MEPRKNDPHLATREPEKQKNVDAPRKTAHPKVHQFGEFKIPDGAKLKGVSRYFDSFK